MTIDKLPDAIPLGTIGSATRPVTTEELENYEVIKYICLNYEGNEMNITYSHIQYFVPKLCKRGLRQCHVAETEGKILEDIHISRQKR